MANICGVEVTHLLLRLRLDVELVQNLALQVCLESPQAVSLIV